MLKGVYVFKENGVEIGRSENIITDRGSEIITAYLSGANKAWAGAVAVGAGATAAASTDSRLNFETFRSAITSLTPQFAYEATPVTGNNRVIAKFKLDSSVACKIYEAGVYPSEFNLAAGVGQGGVISGMDSTEALSTWTTSAGPSTAVNVTSFSTLNNRIGIDSAALTTTSGASYKNTYAVTGLSLDLSAYSGNDVFTFAGIKDTGTVTSFKVRFVTDTNNYFEYAIPTITDVFGAAYNVKSYAKSLWTPGTVSPNTSTSSVTIGTGLQSFTVSSNAYSTGQRIRAYYTTTPTNYVEGVVDATSTSTVVVINVDTIGGSGTYTAWTLSGATQNPDWSNITAVHFLVESSAATATVYLDGLRIDDVDTVNPDFALVSRSVLASPITKSIGTELEVEYYVVFNRDSSI